MAVPSAFGHAYPATHVVQLCVAPSEYFPSLHERQSDEPLEGLVVYFPAGQSVHAGDAAAVDALPYSQSIQTAAEEDA